MEQPILWVDCHKCGSSAVLLAAVVVVAALRNVKILQFTDGCAVSCILRNELFDPIIIVFPGSHNWLDSQNYRHGPSHGCHSVVFFHLFIIIKYLCFHWRHTFCIWWKWLLWQPGVQFTVCILLTPKNNLPKIILDEGTVNLISFSFTRVEYEGPLRILTCTMSEVSVNVRTASGKSFSISVDPALTVQEVSGVSFIFLTFKGTPAARRTFWNPSGTPAYRLRRKNPEGCRHPDLHLYGYFMFHLKLFLSYIVL